ncbi:MAG: MBL fold metallo-hydrolase [Pseudomonadota bacterium]
MPYQRTGPSFFIHDENILIDTPAEIASQLNRSRIERIDYLLFTHLDPDHVEGFRVVEQITLDFRTWLAYEGRRIRLILPEQLNGRLREIRSVYGPLIDFYERQGFVTRSVFRDGIRLGGIEIIAIAVKRGSYDSFVYVFRNEDRKMVYAPCDIKPFPEDMEEVHKADLLVIQPGIFEDGLKHGFQYPDDHISKTTLYTFEETLDLSRRIEARQTLFVHLEEYWNRSHDDYVALEKKFKNVRFAFDGMHMTL